MAEQSKPINPFASLTSNPDVTETRKLFTAHFAGPDEGVIGKWDELWNLWPDAKNKGGEEVKLPFDKGVFNPALDEVLLKGLAGPAIDEVADGTPDGKVENVTAEKLQTVPEVEGTVEKDEQDIFAGPPENKRKPTDRQRKKSLVPGCGKGYDVLLLSAYGFDATGLEVSAKAIEEAEKFKTSVLTQEEEEEEEEEGGLYRIRDESIGRGEVSFLKGDFFGLGGEGYEEGSWDVVYDYTVSSILPPRFVLKPTEERK